MLELTIRLIASLAVVLGLLLVLAKLAGRKFRSGPGATVRVLHRQPLTRTSAVSVIGIGSRVLVVGSTDHQVNLLTELDPDELDWVPDVELAEVSDLARDEAPLPTHTWLESSVAPAEVAVPARRGGSHKATPARTATNRRTTDAGALAGSLLSAQTWRQAFAAATRRAS